MAATVEVPAFSGGTLTLDLYPDGSDTAAASAVTLTEATNRKSIYTGSVTGLTGLHLGLIKSGSTVVGQVFGMMATSGTVVFSERADVKAMAAGTVTAAAVADGAIDNATLASDVRVKLASSQPDYAPLQPTTAGRTLDVAATGEAGLDFDNIKDATGSHTLTNITVPTTTNLTNAPTAGDFTATMKTSITTAVPTVAQVADQVWDEALSGHTTAGTAGKALSDASAAGDPWSTSLPGSYAAGTAGYIIGNIISTLSAAGVSVESPVSTDGDITIVNGDAYLNADGRAISFTADGAPSFSGGTATLTLVYTGTNSPLTITGTVVDADTVRFDVTAAQTANMVGNGAYRVKVVLSDSSPVTVEIGTLRIVAPPA